MRRAGVRALAAAVLLAGAPAARGADALAPSRAQRIDALVRDERARLGIPGLSVAVVRGGTVAFSAGIGVADLENEVPATPETVYRLASLAKPMTAVAVLQLAEAGRLDLDAPVHEYVPGLPPPPRTITARQLLGHLGGVRHYAPGEIESTRRFGSVREGLSMFWDDCCPHEPGARYLYSTYGYTLLGAAVEGASGLPFAEYLRRHVFDPAGMERTRPDDWNAVIPHRASGYRRGPGGELARSRPADTSYKVPGGGLCGTAEDVARFAAALMGGRLIRPETFAQMVRAQATREGKRTGYGLGLNLGQRRHRREAWHRAGQQQVSNVLYLQPDRGTAVVLLTNLEEVSPVLPDVARRIAGVADP